MVGVTVPTGVYISRERQSRSVSLEPINFQFDWKILGGILYTSPEISVKSGYVTHSGRFNQASLPWFWR